MCPETSSTERVLRLVWPKWPSGRRSSPTCRSAQFIRSNHPEMYKMHGRSCDGRAVFPCSRSRSDRVYSSSCVLDWYVRVHVLMLFEFHPPTITPQACHYVFNRFEPHNPIYHFCLLVIAPLTLSPLLIGHFPNIVIAAAATTATYLSTLLLSIAAYRLSPFHPLARYPGPLGCKLSKLWMACICVTGKQHLYYKSLHDRYGDVVRIGPNELSVCDVAAIVPVMGAKGLPKGPCKWCIPHDFSSMRLDSSLVHILVVQHGMDGLLDRGSGDS
jgi:hypothetical protein